MALPGGKSAGKTSGGVLGTDAAGAELVDAGVDMEMPEIDFFFDNSIRRRPPGVSPDFGACWA